MKIQPVDSDPMRAARPGQPVRHQSLLKRLLDKQFCGLRSTTQAAPIDGIGLYHQYQKEKSKDGLFLGSGGEETELSSVCLGKMVQFFLEDTNEKPSICGRRGCRCFNGNYCESSSVDVSDFFFYDDIKYPSYSYHSFPEPSEILESLVPCPTTQEKNLLADAAWIMESNRKIKIGGYGGMKIDGQRRLLVDELIKLGYDSAICLSSWEKTSSFPCGRYEYIDVTFDGEDRCLVDIDFRPQFEIVRPTKKYRTLLQMLPPIFVGRQDRVRQIVAVMCEAAKQSLKKKNLHVPPWRKPEYTRSKWVASYQRFPPPPKGEEVASRRSVKSDLPTKMEWQPPAIERKPVRINPRGQRKILTGLSSIFA